MNGRVCALDLRDLYRISIRAAAAAFDEDVTHVGKLGRLRLTAILVSGSFDRD